MTGSKTVLITGCSAGGIGHALAKEFHSKGSRVFATSRQLESMSELAAIGVETLALDVTDVEAVRKTRDEVSARTGGKLDILVNNAGQAYPMAVTDMDMNVVRALYEVNLFAPMVMVQKFVHLLIASGSGCVVNIGSIAAITPVPFGAAYNSTKAALHAFGNTLRIELAPFNIRVMNVITGTVKSNIVKPFAIPDGSLYEAMDQAFQEKRLNRSQMDAMDTDKYAATVVAEALKPTPRASLWAGNKAWVCWFIDTFLGQKFFNWLMTRMFGLSEFGTQVRNKNSRDKRI